jgi:putative transcriptional regulator
MTAAMTADEIRALRRRLGLTQAAFAARYHLSPRVVANWEGGRDGPSGSAATLLTLIERAPDEVARILARPE